MLTIRDAAWDKLAEAAHADFVARMRAHLRKFFPEQCDALGEVKTGQLIEFGITRAREYGFPGTDDELFRRISPIQRSQPKREADSTERRARTVGGSTSSR